MQSEVEVVGERKSPGTEGRIINIDEAQLRAARSDPDTPGIKMDSQGRRRYVLPFTAGVGCPGNDGPDE